MIGNKWYERDRDRDPDPAEWREKAKEAVSRAERDGGRYAAVKAENDRMRAIIKREVGEAAADFIRLEDSLANAGGWRGRAQEISLLKAGGAVPSFLPFFCFILSFHSFDFSKRRFIRGIHLVVIHVAVFIAVVVVVVVVVVVRGE